MFCVDVLIVTRKNVWRYYSSSGQHLCESSGTIWDTNMAAVSLFCNTNMAAMTSHENSLSTGFGFIQVQFKLDTATLDYEQSLLILSPSSKMQGQANDHACDWRCEMAETPRFLCLVAPRLRAHALLNLTEKRDGSQCRYRPLTIKFPVCVITWHEFTWGPTKNPP